MYVGADRKYNPVFLHPGKYQRACKHPGLTGPFDQVRFSTRGESAGRPRGVDGNNIQKQHVKMDIEVVAVLSSCHGVDPYPEVSSL